jgi:hypothetical protein
MVSANEPNTERDSFHEDYSTKIREKTEVRGKKESKEKRTDSKVRKQERKKQIEPKIPRINKQHQAMEQAIRRNMAIAVMQIPATAQPSTAAYAVRGSGYKGSVEEALLQRSGLRVLRIAQGIRIYANDMGAVPRITAAGVDIQA